MYVVASDPSGSVRVSASGISLDETVALIAGMQRRGDGEPGWNLPDTFDNLIEINGAWTGAGPQRSLTWFDSTQVVAQLLLSPTQTDLIGSALQSSFDRVDIAGTNGWYYSGPGRRAVVWSPDGTTIATLEVVDARVDPLALARSMAVVTRTSFEQSATIEFPAGLGDGCSGSLFC